MEVTFIALVVSAICGNICAYTGNYNWAMFNVIVCLFNMAILLHQRLGAK